VSATSTGRCSRWKTAHAAKGVSTRHSAVPMAAHPPVHGRTAQDQEAGVHAGQAYGVDDQRPPGPWGDEARAGHTGQGQRPAPAQIGAPGAQPRLAAELPETGEEQHVTWVDGRGVAGPAAVLPQGRASE
jgi:hypothetical protein